MSVVARNDDERTVLELFAAWETGDVDRVMEWFTPDARFLNAANPDMPGSPKEGSEAIRELIDSELQTRDVRIEPHRVCSGEDGWVFAERTDWMRPTEGPNAGEWVGFAVTGVLRVTDGRVAEWREYFDLAVVAALLGPVEESEAETEGSSTSR